MTHGQDVAQRMKILAAAVRKMRNARTDEPVTLEPAEVDVILRALKRRDSDG